MAIVLITGCNSGFGMAGALAFARRGDAVHGTVRNKARGKALQALAQEEGLDLHLHTLDVTQPDSFAGFAADLLNETGRLDVLVNNAGILRPGAFEDLKESALREVMETNFFGPMLLTRSFLPALRTQGAGCIIMISSLSGLAGLPGDVAYSASKFALEGATEALRHEIDRWGIRVALVEAGQYNTGLFGDIANQSANYPEDSPYRPLVDSKLREMRDGQAGAMAPDQVGELLPIIADADGSQLRWPADDVARHVLASVHRQTDSERDVFLRGAGGSDWWSQGLAQPGDGEG